MKSFDKLMTKLVFGRPGHPAEGIGIVRELTGRKRNRFYGYSKYVDIINQGTELPTCRL